MDERNQSEGSTAVTEQDVIVQVFEPAQQRSLIRLSAEDFHRLYGDFALLLIRNKDQVVVAGCATNDAQSREVLANRFMADQGVFGIEDYGFEHGPRVLSHAVKALAQKDSSPRVGRRT